MGEPTASGPTARTQPPHGRSGPTTTYVLRAELDGAAPAVWRQLAVSPGLHLDELHVVLQAAFGWDDYHLHRFSSDPDDPWGQPAYLCPFEIAEGDTGVPAELVRAGEVLTDAGERLRYIYDYGDDWRVTLTLEAIETHEESAPPAACRDGHGAEPPEDCGGVPAYEVIVGAQDPSHPDHAELLAEFRRWFSAEDDPARIRLTPFDADTVNARLADLDLGSPPRPREVPVAVADLLAGVGGHPVRRRLLRLLAEAAIDAPVTINPDAAADMMRPYQWLLERVGEDGIKLTKAGYLPPAHVEAAMHDLDLWEEWIGAGNREDLTIPVLDLRESAQQLGLLRKYRGRLLRTKRGGAAASDSVALYQLLAERMPPARRGTAEHRAGTVLLLALAAGVDDTDDADALVTEALIAEGWRHTDGTPLDMWTIRAVQRPTMGVLQRIGALERDRASPGDLTPTSRARPFAHATLATTPHSTDTGETS
ncbi:plasmid pRiA4b ORF-3 family protein [Egibacter rhizosphaerae]|nr:plasmid pRiA4b ORF-3 family protein [Egibacter rhizosphaerae]